MAAAQDDETWWSWVVDPRYPAWRRWLSLGAFAVAFALVAAQIYTAFVLETSPRWLILFGPVLLVAVFARPGRPSS